MLRLGPPQLYPVEAMLHKGRMAGANAQFESLPVGAYLPPPKACVLGVPVISLFLVHFSICNFFFCGSFLVTAAPNYKSAYWALEQEPTTTIMVL